MPEWRRLNRSALDADERLAAAVDSFVSIDTPLGHRAADWLEHDAVANDGSTRTYAALEGVRLSGYFALSAGEVRLRLRDVARLSLPPRSIQPAILLTWIARHRDARGFGPTLLVAAYGKARLVSQDVGAGVLAVDPGDEAVARYWRSVGFRSSQPRRPDAPPRLWARLHLAQEPAE